jgi:hypothetical protein
MATVRGSSIAAWSARPTRPLSFANFRASARLSTVGFRSAAAIRIRILLRALTCGSGAWNSPAPSPTAPAFLPANRLGISMWKEAIGAEAYGNVIYFNGFQASDRGHGHGFYVQNATGTMNIANNIVFDQFDNGLQFYGSGAASEKNLVVQGNISFNNGSISTNSAMADDVIFVNTNGVSGVQLLNKLLLLHASDRKRL